MPAALKGAVGKSQGARCPVWVANLYLHVNAALGLKPFAQVACNDFNKQIIGTGQMYPPGFTVYITLGAL
jgi:hypothetical protein